MVSKTFSLKYLSLHCYCYLALYLILQLVHLDLALGNFIEPVVVASNIATEKKINSARKLKALDDVPSGDPPSFPEKIKNRVESFFRGLPDVSASGKKYFTDEKRIGVIEEWQKNQERLISLYQDSKILRRDSLDLASQTLASWSSFQSTLASPSRGKLTKAVSSLESYNNRIAHFTSLKFLELGQVDLPKSNSKLMTLLHNKDPLLYSKLTNELPLEILDLVIKKIRSTIAEPTLNDLKHLIIDQQLFFRRRSGPPEHPSHAFENSLLKWWRQLLDMIDFLFKNQMVREETVRNFFRGHHMRQQLLWYIELRFQSDLAASILQGSLDFSQHWYWPLLHESFKALNNEDIKELEMHLLLEYRYERIYNQIIQEKSSIISKVFPRSSLEKAWINFFLQSFDHNKYLIKLGVIEKIEQSIILPRSVHDALLLENIEKVDLGYHVNYFIKSNEEEMMNLLKSTVDQVISSKISSRLDDPDYEPVAFLIHVLDLIGRYQSKDLSYFSTVSNTNNHDDDINRIMLFRLDLDARDLLIKSKQHQEYLLKKKKQRIQITTTSSSSSSMEDQEEEENNKNIRVEFKQRYLDPLNHLIDYYKYINHQNFLNANDSLHHSWLITLKKEIGRINSFLDSHFPQ